MSVHLSRPPDQEIRRHLEAQAALGFSYPEVGATRDPARLLGRGFRSRYRLNHRRVQLGRGVQCYARARRALHDWAHFRLPRIELLWPDAPIEPGRCVGVGTRGFGLWFFQPCRIVYVEEESTGPVHSAVFAYGTLPDHALRGEERFAVEHHPGNDTVWYDLISFSRPRLPAMRLGAPWLRGLQARFGAASASAMQRATAEP